MKCRYVASSFIALSLTMGTMEAWNGGAAVTVITVHSHRLNIYNAFPDREERTTEAVTDDEVEA